MSAGLTVTPKGGRREQRRLQLRKAVKDAAWHLVSERGYATVTVEQIAAAADISVATFYRHFSGKDDALTRGWLTLDLMEDGAESVGTRDSLARTVCTLFARYAAIAGTYQVVDLLSRLQLIEREPSLRASMVQGRERDNEMLASLFVQLCGLDQPTHEVRVAAGLVTAARSETMWHWARVGGTGSLGAMLDQAATIIAPALDACEAIAVGGRV